MSINFPSEGTYTIKASTTCSNFKPTSFTYTNNTDSSIGSGDLQTGESKTFGYTGGSQHITLTPGTYKLEAWGAQGGTNAAGTGGAGGYSTGTLTVSTTTTYYIFVGGAGSGTTGGYNGGGAGAGSGGGGGGYPYIHTKQLIIQSKFI